MTEPLWQWDELVAATQGRPDGTPSAATTGFSIDTRTLQPGDVFVALKAARDGHAFVVPDNGLLGRLAECERPSRIRAITEKRWFREPVAPTFHGRDVMAPVAAQLSLGLDPELLGPPHPELAAISWPGAVKVANRIDGEVTAIDSFGNLVTNITRDMLADVPTDESVGVFCDEHETRGIFTTSIAK